MPARPSGTRKNKSARSSQTRKAMPKTKKALAKVVKAVVRRQVETKYVANDFDSAGAPHGAVWYPGGSPTTVADFHPAIPQLGQGIGEFQRIGDKVSPVGMKTTLNFGFNPADLSGNELIVSVYYGVYKSGKTWANANPANSISILNLGTGVNASPTTTRSSLMYPIDTQLVTMKRKVFKLSKTPGLLSATAMGDVSTSLGQSQKSVTLKFRAPKSLKYNLDTDLYPQNYAPGYYITFCNADGSIIDPHYADALVNVTSRNHMWYKDA